MVDFFKSEKYTQQLLEQLPDTYDNLGAKYEFIIYTNKDVNIYKTQIM